MLTLTDVSLRRGTRLLFRDASFTVHSGQKVGVVGANGSGKSSLLALVRGELQADSGEVSLPARAVLAHVAQELPSVSTPAIDFVLDGDGELRALQAALAAAEQQGDGLRVAALHDRLEAVGGYGARARAARLMRGLGFASGEEDRAVSSFSGGWRVRLNLARALMCRSDLLLLDEPTNHLDLDAVIWLQEWLRCYCGTLLLISHDRDFLDEVANHILHIEQETIRLDTGNYTAFETRRAQRLAQQQSAHERQQREVAHMRRFVERFGAKASKARQAQSRLKALARLEAIAPAHVDSPFCFAFPPPQRVPNPLLSLEAVAVGYEGRVVVGGVTLSLRPGDRIGLLGANGAGKSTLVKLLAGELSPLSGSFTAASGLKVGYFAQHQLEQLALHDSPLAHLRRLAPAQPEQALRDFLGGFGFDGEQALASVERFSGGEKARLVLALLVHQGPNLLLLDEPTNHLDLDMRHALTVALQEFTGAMILVSHDRHLLRTVTDDFLLVTGGRVERFDGDLEDYRRWLSNQEQAFAAEQAERRDAPHHTATARKERRREEAERRQRLQPLRKELQRIEAAMERLNAEKRRLADTLAEPALYAGQKERLTALLIEQGTLERELEQMEAQWLSVSEQLEQWAGEA